jgi:serine/threonine-protein kinase
VAFDRRTRFATAEEMAAALEEATTPASTADVAAWIARTAEDLLDTRAQLVREAERYDGERAPSDAPATDATADGTAIVAKVDRPAARRMRIRSVIAAVLALACAGFGFVRLRVSGRAAASTTSAAPATSASAETSGPATLMLDPVVVPVAIASPSSDPSPSPSTAKPRSRLAPRPAAPIRSQSARAACDPPYSIDSDGMKHYKASCLP